MRQTRQGSTGTTVHIVAAADHDGICAAKILGCLLQREGVMHQVSPVTANAEIIEFIKELSEEAEIDELRALVLLNCGASLDVEQQLKAFAVPEQVRCYIIDAHRPFMLANLTARNQRVVVLDDDPMNPVDAPVDEFSDGGDSDAGDSEEEKENVWDPEASGDVQALQEARRERAQKKRRRASDRQDRIERKRQRINEYYLCSYFATPSAISVFKMAKQAFNPSQDFLWLAAVSLSSYHDLGLISEVEYNRLAWEELKESLDRTAEFPYTSENDLSSAGDTGDAPAEETEDISRGNRRRARQVGKQRLRFETDLRLTLYKHWNLEESIMHSAYFYGTLELYRDKGQRALKEFFAKAGIPPGDFKQVYSMMDMPIRTDLHDKFRRDGKAYGLVESKMFLQQFVRELGPLGDANPALFLRELSCADAVHIMTSLICAVPASFTNGRVEAQTEDGKSDMEAINKMEREAMVANFYKAFDACLSKEDPKLLRLGLEEAVQVAKAIQTLARNVKDTKALHSTRQFRWCKIEQPPPIFRHHLIVRRLAAWILQVHFTYRPKGDGPEKPLLVIVRDQVRDTYLCVGATPTRLSEQDEFGNRFRTVLRADDSLRYRYDFLDKSCIEIASDDFDRFWELMSGGG